MVAGAADGGAGEHGATAAAGHRQRRRTARAMASLGHGERWPARGDGEEARLTSKSRDGAARLVGVDGDADEEEEGRRG